MPVGIEDAPSDRRIGDGGKDAKMRGYFFEEISLFLSKILVGWKFCCQPFQFCICKKNYII